MPSVLDSIAGAVVPSVFKKGLPLPDAVTVRIGTDIYDSWKSVEISRSIENISSSFSLSMVDRWRQDGSKWRLIPGEQVRINIGINPIINGYIDRLDVSISNDDRTITVSGRDKTGDLVDSSALTEKNEFRDVSLETIIKHFADLFGLKVTTEADTGEKFKVWTIQQGETVFETMARAAALRSVLLLSDENGDIVIANRAGGSASAPPSATNLKSAVDFVASAAATAGLAKSAVSLIQGNNVLTASASYDNTDRFSDYVVKGQRPGTDTDFGAAVTGVKATAKDLGVDRFRPTVVISEGSIDTAAAKRRANWEATIRAAKALDVNVTVQGWLKADKSLWVPNELVRTEVGFLGIESDLLVSAVRYLKSDQGTVTALKLTRPDAFNPKEEIKKEKDPVQKEDLGWGSPADALGKAVDLITGE